MAADNLQIAQRDWTRRQADFVKAGGKAGLLAPLIQEDYQRVLHGSTPYNDTQAYQQMSAILGKPLVPPQQTGSGFGQLFGNAVGDIRNMVAGVGKIGIEALIPTEWPTLGHQLEQAFVDPALHHLGDPKYAFGLPEVPGLTTLGDIVSGQSDQLLAHPVNTLLDLSGPLSLATKGISEVAGLTEQVGAVDKAAEAAGAITSTGRSSEPTLDFLASSSPLTVNQYKWMKALSEGHPLQALMTGSDRLQGIQDALGLIPRDIKEKLNRTVSVGQRVRSQQLSAAVSDVKQLDNAFKDDSRALDIANRYMASMTQTGDVVTGLANVSDEDITYLAQKAGLPERELRAKFVKIRQDWEQVRASFGQDKDLVPLEFTDASGNVRTFHLPSKTANGKPTKIMKAYTALKKAEDDQKLIKGQEAEFNKIQQVVHAGGKLGPDAADRAKELSSQIAKVNKAYRDAQSAFASAVQTDMPVEYAPALSQKMRQDILSGKAKFTNIDPNSPEFQKALEGANSFQAAKNVFASVGGDQAAKDYVQFVKDTVGGWQQLAKQGFDPVWFGKTGPNEIFDNNRVKIDFNTKSPMSIVHTGLDLSPSINDNFIGLTRMAKLALEYNAETAIAQDLRKSFGVSEQTARDALRKEIELRRRAPTGDALDRLVTKQYNERYRNVEVAGLKDIVVPKPLADQIEKLKDKVGGGAMTKAARAVLHKETGLYKAAVMLSPRHLAHVTFGGLMMLTLDEPGALTRIIQANRLYHDIHNVLPEIMSGQGLAEPENMASFASGKTLGRLYTQLHKGGDAIKRFEDKIANVQKAAVALSVAHGDLDALRLTDGAINHVREAALDQVYKTFVNMDDATPLERTILKNVFPFYGFTKHILKFTLQYPIDHPYRAEILNKLAQQELADQQSGLPLDFARIFWIGQQDSSGNRLGVDLRSWNPFRSLSGDYTLAGFISNLNPAISLPFELAGINKLTGTSELYPQLSIDPATGGLVAKRSSPTDVIADIVPEGQVVDHFLKFSASMRSLASSNPDAYRQQLWTALGLSFMPQQYNIPLDKAKYAYHNLLVAQQAVSNYLNTGDEHQLSGWERLPYQGQFVTPAELKQLYSAMDRTLKLMKLPTDSIKAITPPKRKKGHFSFASLMQGLP